MAETWDRRIRRAEELTVGGGPQSPLLAFYARLLQSQKAVYESSFVLLLTRTNAARLCYF